MQRLEFNWIPIIKLQDNPQLHMVAFYSIPLGLIFSNRMPLTEQALIGKDITDVNTFQYVLNILQNVGLNYTN
jgi:hypothetical protein